MSDEEFFEIGVAMENIHTGVRLEMNPKSGQVRRLRLTTLEKQDERKNDDDSYGYSDSGVEVDLAETNYRPLSFLRES